MYNWSCAGLPRALIEIHASCKLPADLDQDCAAAQSVALAQQSARFLLSSKLPADLDQDSAGPAAAGAGAVGRAVCAAAAGGGGGVLRGRPARFSGVFVLLLRQARVGGQHQRRRQQQVVAWPPPLGLGSVPAGCLWQRCNVEMNADCCIVSAPAAAHGPEVPGAVPRPRDARGVPFVCFLVESEIECLTCGCLGVLGVLASYLTNARSCLCCRS